MAQPKIQIKGIREGLLLVAGEGSWEEIHHSILTQLDEQASFLKGGRLALDLGNQILKAVEMSKLRDEISERGLTLWAVLSNSPTTEQTAQSLGMATRLNKPHPEREAKPLDTSVQSGEQAVLIHRTLRSGYSLHFNGHVGSAEFGTQGKENPKHETRNPKQIQNPNDRITETLGRCASVAPRWWTTACAAKPRLLHQSWFAGFSSLEFRSFELRSRTSDL